MKAYIASTPFDLAEIDARETDKTWIVNQDVKPKSVGTFDNMGYLPRRVPKVVGSKHYSIFPSMQDAIDYLLRKASDRVSKYKRDLRAAQDRYDDLYDRAQELDVSINVDI